MIWTKHITAIQLNFKFFDESFVIDIKATSGNNRAEISEYEWANMKNISQNPAHKMLLHIQYKQKTQMYYYTQQAISLKYRLKY